MNSKTKSNIPYFIAIILLILFTGLTGKIPASGMNYAIVIYFIVIVLAAIPIIILWALTKYLRIKAIKKTTPFDISDLSGKVKNMSKVILTFIIIQKLVIYIFSYELEFEIIVERMKALFIYIGVYILIFMQFKKAKYWGFINLIIILIIDLIFSCIILINSDNLSNNWINISMAISTLGFVFLIYKLFSTKLYLYSVERNEINQ